MLGIIIFLACGWLVMTYGKPLQHALIAAGISALLSLAFGASLLPALVAFVLMAAMFTGFYLAVDYFADDVIKPIAILVTGAVAMALAAFL